MSIKIISVLCEGPHDVAFIAKVLKISGFKSNESTKLAKFPSPMNSLFKTEATKTNIEELNFAELRQTLLPSATLQKGDIYLFLYALGGDTRKDNRNKILKQFLSFIPKESEISSLPENTTLSIVYFFDADDMGIDGRIKLLNTEIEETLEQKPFDRNGDMKTIKGLKIGCYIFSENETGKLENIVLPLMKQGNEQIFDDAKQFIDTNYDNKRDKGYDFHKASIGIAGQLQKSGSTNTVIIAQSDFLSKEKIMNNSKCIEIIAFFELFF